MRRRVTVLVLCVCLSVCLSVCVSVCYHSSGNIGRFYAENDVYLRLFSVFNLWIFDKSFCSKVMVRKSQYANEQLPLATGF